MYELKTKATDVSIQNYLQGITSDERRADCERLIDLMSHITGSPPVMWGPSIVGFGRYHYKYDSGHEGDMCVVGFASRKAELVVYLMAGYDEPATKALLARLGKVRTGKSCLYIKRLAGADLDALETLIRNSVEFIRARYGLQA
jgi:hypothetical protein